MRMTISNDVECAICKFVISRGSEVEYANKDGVALYVCIDCVEDRGDCTLSSVFNLAYAYCTGKLW